MVGKPLARPQIARALIAAGHVGTVAEAFDKYLSETSPAYVPHRGASPADVVELVTAAGGLASLAHPGYTKKDEIIPSLVAAGLGAIEAYHSSHDLADADTLPGARRAAMALVSRADPTFTAKARGASEFFGVTNLPVDRFEELLARAGHVRAG